MRPSTEALFLCSPAWCIPDDLNLRHAIPIDLCRAELGPLLVSLNPSPDPTAPPEAALHKVWGPVLSVREAGVAQLGDAFQVSKALLMAIYEVAPSGGPGWCSWVVWCDLACLNSMARLEDGILTPTGLPERKGCRGAAASPPACG
jgi:hypothetical protein